MRHMVIYYRKMRDKIESYNKRITPYLFALCILVLSGFSLWFLLVREPIGDDIMGFFDKGISFYLDEMDDTLGERITTVNQSFKTVWLIYTTWSGRIIGYIFNALSGVLPEGIKAIIGTGVLAANVLLVLTIAYGSIREVLYHPFIYTVLYLVMYWYRPEGYYEYMWTMISVYEIPLLFCLVFCVYMINGDRSKKELWPAFFLGFFAGISNEICAVLTVSLLGIIWLSDLLKKRIGIKSILLYFGLFAGTVINVFAPGNFNRLNQSHDESMHTMPLLLRMKNSLGAHKNILISGGTTLRIAIAAIILLCFGLVIKYLVNHGITGLKDIFKEIYPYLIACFTSIVVWGCMSRTPTYGLSFWLAFVYVTIIKTLQFTINDNYTSLLKSVTTIACAMLVASFVLMNSGWMIKHTDTSLSRQRLINEAVSNGQKSVTVPRYSDDALGRITDPDCLNGQLSYDDDAYRAYYGIQINLSQE